MTKRKKNKQKKMVENTFHRKLKIELHELTKMWSERRWCGISLPIIGLLIFNLLVLIHT